MIFSINIIFQANKTAKNVNKKIKRDCFAYRINTATIIIPKDSNNLTTLRVAVRLEIIVIRLY